MKIRNLTRQHGFTLIELLIVLAIIAIRTAVAIAGYYIDMQNRARRMVLVHEKPFFYRSTRAKPVTNFVSHDMLCSIVIYNKTQETVIKYRVLMIGIKNA